MARLNVREIRAYYAKRWRDGGPVEGEVIVTKIHSAVRKRDGQWPRRWHPCRKVRWPGVNTTLTYKKRGNPLQTGQDRVNRCGTSNWTASRAAWLPNPP
jgi:hypothetical protein